MTKMTDTRAFGYGFGMGFDAERDKLDRGGRASLKKYYSNPKVREAVLNYSNNRGSQRDVKTALKSAGASESEIAGINWSKSYFPQREFE